MKKFKKAALTAASYVSVAALAIGGTLAFYTDRASVPNTFTVGDVDIELNEDFEQGSKLIPGVNIEKKPTITNVGEEDAYVWLTFSIPTAFDNFVQGTDTGSNENMIHWNPMGATTEGYVNKDRVDAAVEAGRLPEGTTFEDITTNNKTWNVFNSIKEGENCYQEDINGISYNTYVLLYNKALEPGETTLPNIEKVFLDEHIDIAPDGEMYRVEKGEAKALDWNVDEDGAPVIYVNAYGIQATGISDVSDAYQAYIGQWDKLNASNAKVTEVDTASDLVSNLANGEVVLLTDNITSADESAEAKNIITSDSTVNFADNTITLDLPNATGSTENWVGVNVDGGNVVFNATDGGIVTANNGELYAVVVRNGANLTINGGNYIGGTTAVQVSEGTLTINGGYFEAQDDDKTFTINCKDAAYKNGTAKVIIKGGTFKGWNPANNAAEGAGTNFVAPGYKSVDNNDGTFTVVAE